VLSGVATADDEDVVVVDVVVVDMIVVDVVVAA